jgi:hypothetical protein
MTCGGSARWVISRQRDGVWHRSVDHAIDASAAQTIDDYNSSSEHSCNRTSEPEGSFQLMKFSGNGFSLGKSLLLAETACVAERSFEP